ncbi:MAG: lipoyl(octanoyl) transferase LipB [Candidatus Dormibacteria bacterium]
MDSLQHIWLGTVGYDQAWALQRRLAAARAAGHIGDCVLCLEHPPVYTLGRSTEPAHLGDGIEALRLRGAECIEVDRGGSVTFHGPGQLVAYPILALSEHFPVPGSPGMGDVIAYVRTLEAALIASAAACGVSATRRDGYTGAWVGRDKLAAIGVKLAGGITQHGISLNVDVDLSWFSHVTPCGIEDGDVTSLRRLGIGDVSPADLLPVFSVALAGALGVELESADDMVKSLCAAAAEQPDSAVLVGSDGKLP